MRLERLLESTNLSHALILAGPQAECEHWLEALLSKRYPEQLVRRYTGLKKADIKELIDFYTTNEGVVVIDHLHQASVAANNALLKFMEEPQPGRNIIILCDAIHRLLPTIRSRCQIWQVDSVQEDDFLVRYGYESQPEARVELEKLAQELVFNPSEQLYLKLSERFTRQTSLAEVQLFLQLCLYQNSDISHRTIYLETLKRADQTVDKALLIDGLFAKRRKETAHE